MRRWMTRGLVLAAIVSATTACTADTDAGGTSRSAQALGDPAVVLAASTEVLAEESYRFEVTMAPLMSATGAVDPAAAAANVTVSVSADGVTHEVAARLAGEDVWVSLGEMNGLLGIETAWMHIDQSRLGERGLAGLQPGELDLVGAAELLRDLGNVEQIDADTFRGEITLTRGAAPPLADQALEALGEQSVTLQFEATVDDQRRLTRLVIEYPAGAESPVRELELRFFDFGSPVEVTPPPADQVTEMPAGFYRMLGG
jgi:hypothetical protein